MFKEHPLRRALAEEIHARPPANLAAPVQVSHIALISGEDGMAPHVAHLEALCKHFRVAPPSADATHFSADLGEIRLTWERHTEFSTFTIIRPGAFAQPFKGTAVDGLPKDWLTNLPGQVIAACHVAVETGQGSHRTPSDLAGLFDNNPLNGSIVSGGSAWLWTDFQLHSDGFTRFLFNVGEITPPTLGRLVQRMLEIETYRMMAMLAFPLAKESRPRLTAVETKLGGIIARLGTREAVEDERQLLDDLSALAAETEAVNVATAYRFAATGAYEAIVYERISALREARFLGRQGFGEFMMRRYAPAMRTVKSTETRLQTLAARALRAADLLRTRVDVERSAQNQAILASMDRRADLQLRLQHTVEGLSVVAISYYAVSLAGYLLYPLAAPLGVSKGLLTAAVTLPVVLGVWWTLRRLRRKIG